MKYCTTCLQPDTRPNTAFSADGQCPACSYFIRLQDVDWEERFAILERLIAEMPRSEDAAAVVDSPLQVRHRAGDRVAPDGDLSAEQPRLQRFEPDATREGAWWGVAGTALACAGPCYESARERPTHVRPPSLNQEGG